MRRESVKGIPSVELEKLRKALKKGHRSILIHLKNSTSQNILRKGDHATINGKWVTEPPTAIPSQGVASFGAIGKGVLAGTDGQISYQLPGIEGEFRFIWNNGKEKDKRGWNYLVTEELRDSPYEITMNGEGDKHVEVTFAILQLDFQDAAAQSNVQDVISGKASFASDSSAPSDRKASGARFASGELEPPSNADNDASDIKEEGDDGFGQESTEKKLNIVIKKDAPVAAPASGADLVAAAQNIFKAKPAPGGIENRRLSTIRRDRMSTRNTNNSSLKEIQKEGQDAQQQAVNTARYKDDDHIAEAKSSLRTCIYQLEGGNFDNGLNFVDQALRSLTSTSDPKAQQKVIKVCSNYKLALQVLAQTRKTDFDASKNIDLFTLLALLPLKPEHRIVNMRRLVNENFAVGNYDFAAKFLEILIPLGLKDKDQLSAKLQECKDKGKNDAAPHAPEKQANGEVTKFCFKEHTPLGATHLKCGLCSAVYSDKALSAGDKCIMCDSEKVTA